MHVLCFMDYYRSANGSQIKSNRTQLTFVTSSITRELCQGGKGRGLDLTPSWMAQQLCPPFFRTERLLRLIPLCSTACNTDEVVKVSMTVGVPNKMQGSWAEKGALIVSSWELTDKGSFQSLLPGAHHNTERLQLSLYPPSYQEREEQIHEERRQHSCSEGDLRSKSELFCGDLMWGFCSQNTVSFPFLQLPAKSRW